MSLVFSFPSRPKGLVVSIGFAVSTSKLSSKLLVPFLSPSCHLRCLGLGMSGSGFRTHLSGPHKPSPVSCVPAWLIRTISVAVASYVHYCAGLLFRLCSPCRFFLFPHPECIKVEVNSSPSVGAIFHSLSTLLPFLRLVVPSCRL